MKHHHPPLTALMTVMLSAALAAAGRTETALAVLREAEKAMAGEPGCPLEIAALRTAVGERARALSST